MPASKIVVYFTPDVREIGRIPINDIKFETTKGTDEQFRGTYKISIEDPSLINGQCVTTKATIASTASLIFKWHCFGELTKYVFQTNDYFEIWDTADSNDEWCFFRGVLNHVSLSEQGNQKRVTLMLENACGWVLGDNAIYYLHPLIIARGQAPTNFFDPIKTRYGWLQGGNLTNKWDDLQIERIKKPSELLETLINKIGNVRINLLKKDWYDNSKAIKPISYITESQVEKNDIFIPDKLSEMEGSILDILKQYQGSPFCEMFLTETSYGSIFRWRNSRWRDYTGELCMREYAGYPQNLVSIYTNPAQIFSSTKKSPAAQGSDYAFEKFYKGPISENINRTNDDVVNAIYLYPATMDIKDNVPAMVIAQTRYDENSAKNILDLNSIIRHGYKPITLKLPFIPQYMDQEAFSKTIKDNRFDTEDANYTNIGKFLSEYSEYAASMYRNIQNASNGQDTFQTNLHVTIADDYRIVRNQEEDSFWINVNQITWYLDPENPTTVIEWDRGFERKRYMISAKDRNI